ncbi:MAG: hypothetical protein J6I64_09350, partial [Lachnospiraceae bacterium]|nr:hypothetical protein [Lachnospiraceae bacterium]
MRRVRTLSELFCLLLLLMLTFTGCQLAQEDGAEDMAANMVANMVGTSDRLAGVLITTDYLDLFDFEAYLTENMDDPDGGQINAEDSQKYNGRIYVVLETKTSTDTESGRTITTQEYVFPTIEGIEYFAYQITTDTGDIYTTSTMGQGLSDSKMHIHSTDHGDFVTLDAVLYVTAQKKSMCYYFN